MVKSTGRWFRLALINLLIAAVIGVFLRLAFIVELPWLNFRYALHGHSHIAMLGWGYMALFALLVHNFIDDYAQRSKVYHRLFWATELAVVGMMISFPLKGYHLVSVAFSTLHVILSYVFIVRFWRDSKRSKGQGRMSLQFARTALLFLILSSVALWLMGPLIALEQQGTAWYFATIQFFLHFQFNGWFVFAVLAIFFRWLEKREIAVDAHDLNRFYLLLVLSCILTYVLAVTWSTPLDILFWINSLGVVIQLGALILFFKLIRPVVGAMRMGTTRMLRTLFGVGLMCFVVKIFVQTAVVVPHIATIAYTIRSYVIGFIHLILLGLLTHMLIGFAHSMGILRLERKSAVIGVLLLVTGFLLTEGLLVIQGTLFWIGIGFIPYYYELLFAASCLLPVSILLLLGSRPHLSLFGHSD